MTVQPGGIPALRLSGYPEVDDNIDIQLEKDLRVIPTALSGAASM